MADILDPIPTGQRNVLLCCYVNGTNNIQVARITNIENWYFERVVFPGQRLVFEALPKAQLEIHTGMMASAILSETIPCECLCINDREIEEYRQQLKNKKYEQQLLCKVKKFEKTANYYLVENHPEKAKYYYHKIIAILDILQKEKNIFERRALLKPYLAIYQRLVSLGVYTKDYNLAFLYTEFPKNRYLVERLAHYETYLPTTISKKLVKQIEIAKQLENKTLQKYTYNISQNLNKQKLSELQKYWLEARENLGNLYTQVSVIEPEFIAKNKVYPIYFEQVQNLISLDTAIVEFFFTEKNLVTMLIVPGIEQPIISKELCIELKDKSVDNIVKNWVDDLSLKSLSRKEENFKNNEIKLDEIIDYFSSFLNFNQLLNFIPDNIKHLIIVPHNYLHLFPIHALWINKKDNKRLIDQFSVSYFPSLQVWKICQNRQRSQQSLLAIENPTEDKDLIFAKAEIASISQHQNFNQQQTLTEKNATIENILKNAQNYHCLHFSGHAEYNFKNPLHSYLMLSHNTTDNLTLNTIFSDLHIPHTDLVILSACCTGVVDADQPTEEHLGLPTGFLLAGAKAVIASQWKVNSIATAFLFDEFYHQLQTTNNKAIALKNAQIWLRSRTAEELRNRAKKWNLSKLESKERFRLDRALKRLRDIPFQHPYFWAAFTLTGK